MTSVPSIELQSAKEQVKSKLNRIPMTKLNICETLH